MTEIILHLERFEDISLDDPFFDSLKSDYSEFESWFRKKRDKHAYTFRGANQSLDGFLYLKLEDGDVEDTTPPLPNDRRLKIWTFKINPHGTRLGERFIKRAFDIAIEQRAKSLYATIFQKHNSLIKLFQKYGFQQVAIKNSKNGQELVLERRLDRFVDDVVLDYPKFKIKEGHCFVISIYPKWHSRLLPDSLLKTERTSILEDISHTNSIHKIYLTAMKGVENLKRGDVLLIYRTADGGSAYYTSVATSLCIVEDLRNISTFHSLDDFLKYCHPYSIFTKEELEGFYCKRNYPWIIRFTYNLALKKRPNRKALIEEVGINPNTYFGFFPIKTAQLRKILQLSGDYEKASSIIHSP